MSAQEKILRIATAAGHTMGVAAAIKMTVLSVTADVAVSFDNWVSSVSGHLVGLLPHQVHRLRRQAPLYL